MTDLLILCYHAVSDEWPTELAISPRRLDAQLAFLLRRGYRPTTLSEALREPVRGRSLVVTFDDAYRSVLTRAFPLLASLDIPATVYVPTAYVADETPIGWSSLARWAGTRFAEELRCMSWQELRSLAGAGWEIGSHGNAHSDLTALSDADLEAELRLSRARCEEELQRACRTLAYPFGAHDRRVMSQARAAGYESAVILDNHVAIPNGSLFRPGRTVEMFALLREGVYRRDGWSRFLAKTSPLVRRARSFRPLRGFS